MISVSKKTIESKDGALIYYEKYDLKNDRQFIFLIHGVGGDLDAWQYIKDKLLENGFSCIALDLRGHGYSSHPRSFDHYKLQHFLEDFIAVTEAEKLKKVILVGHSLGAILATHIALEYPNKLTKLILISPSDVPPPYLRIPVVKQLSVAFINLCAFVSPAAYKPQHSRYPVGKFHKDYEPVGLIRTMWHNSLRSYLLSSKEILLPDISKRIAEITLPTLIISGDKDSIFPTFISQRIQQAIIHSKLTILPNSNHVLVLNNIPEVTHALIDFIL
jgi:pimeloyl-ACP methyl ester carboxylesterase